MSGDNEAFLGAIILIIGLVAIYHEMQITKLKNRLDALTKKDDAK